ncbi:hypothetical protein VNI00_017088 [Paramarasmius palmivorus]
MPNTDRRKRQLENVPASLCYDTTQEVLKWSIEMRREDGGSIWELLLLERNHTNETLKITRSTTISLLHRTVLSNPALFRKTRTACIACNDLLSMMFDTNQPQIACLIADIVRAVSSTVETLDLKLRFHPGILHALRTTLFPKLRVLAAPVYFLLDVNSSIRIHAITKNIGYGTNRIAGRRNRITVAGSESNWPILNRVFVTCFKDAPSDLTSTLDISYMASVKELAIVMHNRADWAFNVSYFLSNIVLPPNVEVI